MESWSETTATVIASIYHYAKFRDISSDTGTRDSSYFVTTFSYRVKGEVYFGEIDPDQERVDGEQFILFYDPDHPQHNSMETPPPTLDHNIVSKLIFGAFALLVIYLINHYE